MSHSDEWRAGWEAGLRAAAELALEMAAEQEQRAERVSPPLRQGARDRAEAYREVARRMDGITADRHPG